ncbi:MAG: chemotaxis protein CheW [Ignavibacteriaceae bacterium]
MSIPASFIESLNGILIFEVDRKEFCINNKFVSEILSPADISLSSDTREILVFEYSDMLLKIIDSENAIHDEDKKINALSRILIFEVNGNKFGLLVDNVKEIVAEDRNFVEKFMAEVTSDEKDRYVSALLKLDGRNIKFLDIEKICRERVGV